MKGIPLQSLLMWAAIVFAQALAAVRSFRVDRALYLYLISEITCSVAGMAAMFSGNVYLYSRAYGYAGLWDDVATATLMLLWLNDLRQRSRPRRSGFLLAGVLIAAAAIFAVHISSGPLPQISGSFWATTHAVSHIVWLWLSMITALIPLYCACTMARPDRVLTLKLLGLGVYVCIHSGLVDLIVLGTFAHIQAVKALLDFVYLLPLALWLVALEPKRAARETIAVPVGSELAA
jgi:hypothetical protein